MYLTCVHMTTTYLCTYGYYLPAHMIQVLFLSQRLCWLRTSLHRFFLKLLTDPLSGQITPYNKTIILQ